MTISLIEPTGRTVGAAPLFRQFADEIALVPLLNQMLRWDTRQTHVSPGERILLLILDVLAGKSPLYRMADRLVTTDVEVLTGAGRRPADFSDDSLGRALDKCLSPVFTKPQKLPQVIAKLRSGRYSWSVSGFEPPSHIGLRWSIVRDCALPKHHRIWQRFFSSTITSQLFPIRIRADWPCPPAKCNSPAAVAVSDPTRSDQSDSHGLSRRDLAPPGPRDPKFGRLVAVHATLGSSGRH